MWNMENLKNTAMERGVTYKKYGYTMAPNITRTVSCKAWSTPVKYHSLEYKFDVMESHSEMLNPIS